MKITRIAAIFLLGILLVSGFACCPAPEPAPTPTPTPTPTLTPTRTPTPTPTGQVMKPIVNYIPSDWELEEDTPYPQYIGRLEGVNWGLLDYTDQVDWDYVYIWYGNIAPELEGKENDAQALIDYALAEMRDVAPDFMPDESGMMTIDGQLAGYIKAYDADLDVYDLRIDFIKGATSVDIFASYDATTADEAQVMSLINSIHVP